MANSKDSAIANPEIVDSVEEASEPNSKFQLVILAAQRCKQLIGGAKPRVQVENAKAKDTYIAVNEIRQGLIFFSETPERV